MRKDLTRFRFRRAARDILSEVTRLPDGSIRYEHSESSGGCILIPLGLSLGVYALLKQPWNDPQTPYVFAVGGAALLIGIIALIGSRVIIIAKRGELQIEKRRLGLGSAKAFQILEFRLEVFDTFVRSDRRLCSLRLNVSNPVCGRVRIPIKGYREEMLVLGTLLNDALQGKASYVDPQKAGQAQFLG